MKARTLFFTLLTAAVLPPLGARQGEIRLLNGDRAEGRFLGMERAMLRLAPAWGGVPLEVPAAYTGALVFRDSLARVEAGDAHLVFANGDRLTVLNPTVTHEAVKAVTLWGEEIHARRDMVRSIRFLPPSEDRLLYGSAADLDWRRMVDGDSHLQGGRLLLDASPTWLELPRVPDKMDLKIRARVHGPRVHLAMDLLFDDLSRERGINTGLRFTLTNTILRTHIHEGAPRRGPGIQRQLRVDLSGEKLVLRLRGNMQTNQMVLTVNETYVQEIDLGELDSLEGNENMVLRLRSSHDRTQFEIESLVLFRERGVLEGPKPIGDGDLPATLLYLHNGDQVEVRDLALREGELEYKTVTGRTTRMNAEIVREIRFAGGGETPLPRRDPRDTEIFLEGFSDRLTLGVLSWEEDLKGEGDQWLSPLVVPLAWIRRVRFNPYSRFRLDQEVMELDPRVIFL